MRDTKVLSHATRRMDAEALTEVFDLYAPAIYKYALRHCNNAIVADQIVGDVFAKLLEQLSLGSGPSSNIRSYLFEIAYHAIVDEFRYYRRIESIGSVEAALPAANYTDVTAEEEILIETIRKAMRKNLTEDQRHVIILRLMEGFSLKETALIMGITVANVKIIQNRAIAALRKAINYQVMEIEYVRQDVLRLLAG